MSRRDPLAEYFNPTIFHQLEEMLIKHRRKHQHVPQSEIDLADTDLYRQSDKTEFEVTFRTLVKGLRGCWHPVNQGTHMISYFPSADTP